MHVWAGTSGYSYKEWKGSFYPEKLAAADMLAHYARRLSAVEINNTFYRLPKTSVLDAWAAQVPEGFRFVIKASRRITHLKRLKDVDEETGYLLETVTTLGPRLGALLFQLPPNLKRDLDRLDAFLALLPRGPRAAFEFRHESWLDDEVFARLRARDCALCVADTEDGLDAPAISTASWGYLRLRRPEYSDAELDEWAARVRGQTWSDAFIFFKHEDEASGPLLAEAFRRRFPDAEPGAGRM
jgi:uncharacterized protein YecE (DUF72 family)